MGRGAGECRRAQGVGRRVRVASLSRHVARLELPRRLVAAFTGSGLLLSGGSQNNYTSGLVTSLLQSGAIQEYALFTLLANFNAAKWKN